MDIAEDPTLAAFHKNSVISTDERLLIATLKTKITGTPAVFLNIIDYIRPPTMSSELQTQIQKEGKRTACLHLIRCANRMASDTDNKITATASKRLDQLEESMVPEEEYEGCCYDSYCRCPALPDKEPTYMYHSCRSCQDCWQMCLNDAMEKYGHSQVPYFLDYFYDIDQLYRLCENELVEGSQLYADGLHPRELGPYERKLNPHGYSRHDRRFCQTNLLWDMLGYMEEHHDTPPDKAPYYPIPGMGYGINYHWKAHVDNGSWIDELYQ